HHGDAGVETAGEIEGRDGTDHLVTQAAAADQAGNHSHRQREHDHLVDTSHDGGQGQWHLDILEDLPWSSAEGLPCLDYLAVDLADAELSESYGWGKSEDHRGDQRARYADAEQLEH